MKVYIVGRQYEKIIETTASLDEIVASGSIVPFFQSLDPPHTGSSEFSGSIHSTNYGEWFEGETYSFEEI